jgi:tripartite-type tricarboxylate transporter receptor subunit TctC
MKINTGSINFIAFMGLILLSLLGLPGSALAEYPERPITIVVGFDPGAATDIMTRTMSAGAEKQLGKPIVIENKGGGGGSVAMGIVANAKPDGYTLCGAPNVSMIDTALMQKVTFKPLKSFTPIVAHSAAEHTALLVKNDAPWKTFKEFIDYAKKNPGKVKYSSSGVGTGMHVAMEVIAHKEGIKWVHVPYKGSAPATAALLGGHVDACSAGIGYQPHVLSGALRIFADHGLKRQAAFPNVPTLKELGYDYYNDTMHAIVGPAGLPPEVVKKLESAFAKGMETAEFKSAQEKLYLNPIHYDSKEYERLLKEKWTRMEKMFKDTGIIKEAATQPF